jgi:hypothetical protein|tara:strand:+ start:469 stop:642 length:174 start_codon:yes stop_codon:yes gene_type:complete
MGYVILKHSDDSKHTVIINDSEGVVREFDTQEQAQSIADLFKANTTHDSIYEVKKLS